MEQQPQTTQVGSSSEVANNTKAPAWVQIISWLLLLAGIGRVFLGLLTLIVSPLIGAGILLVGIGFIATSFGFRSMKKWALYIYTILVLLGAGILAQGLMQHVKPDIIGIGEPILEVLLLIYVWTLAKKFK